MSILHEILQAEHRIRPYVRETPLDASSVLSAMGKAQVAVKLENLQFTGSFKLRGAMNKLLSLSPQESAAGVVTASSGNHGAAVAYGLAQLGAKGKIFVPETISPAKEMLIRHYGAQIHKAGLDSGISELEARKYAETQGVVYISPYNDPQVIGGQGTIGIEIARQMAAQPGHFVAHQPTVIFVSLGGGGLISGIAAYLKTVAPATQIVACSPTNSAVMQHSVLAGKIIEEESLETLSDGTAGSVEPGAMTFELVRDLVDQYVDVSEAEIKTAMRLFLEQHHMMIEGSAGVALAGYLRLKDQFTDCNVVIVLCGANISLARLSTVIA